MPTAGSETAFVLVTFMLTELGEGQMHVDDYTSEYIGWTMRKKLDFFAKIKLCEIISKVNFVYLYRLLQ